MSPKIKQFHDYGYCGPRASGDEPGVEVVTIPWAGGPRASGDEPFFTGGLSLFQLWSPRERG